MQKYHQALWISHSCLSDFDACPRAYFFKHLFRNPQTGNKIRIVSPYLTLGTIVHKTLQDLTFLLPEQRLALSLSECLEKNWGKQGKRGGFFNSDTEEKFKARGLLMVKTVEKNPEFLLRPSFNPKHHLVKLRLFKDENLILIGGLDWIEQLQDETLHIIDFKTGKNEEPAQSLQLPIYFLLAKYNFAKPVAKTSYWYLEKETKPKEIALGDQKTQIAILREKAKNIEKAVNEHNFNFCSGRSFCDCWKYQKAAEGGAEYVGYDQEMQRDLFYI